jgi:hypothetical protein
MALQRDIRELIDIVVHIERREGKRFVSQVLRTENTACNDVAFDAEK